MAYIGRLLFLNGIVRDISQESVEGRASFKLPVFNLYVTKNYLLPFHQRRIAMNEEQNDRRWFQTKCDCGKIVLIDSEEFPVFFSEPDDENGLWILVATCPKCSNTIEFKRDDIGNTDGPSGPTPDKLLLKWKLEWK